MKGLFGFGKKETKAETKEEAKTDQSPLLNPKKWLVQYDRKVCIGAGTCEAVNPERWKLLDERKAELRGSELNQQNNLYELRIGDEELTKMKAAAEGCPKNVIHITNTETGEKII